MIYYVPDIRQTTFVRMPAEQIKNMDISCSSYQGRLNQSDNPISPEFTFYFGQLLILNWRKRQNHW